MFHLLWTQHGGSGTNLTLSDLDTMTLDEIHWWATRINEQRKREAKALRDANRRKT